MSNDSTLSLPDSKPFLRWPGGKRWLRCTLLSLLAERKVNRYFEPFLGGGAIFFSLIPKKAVLADINIDLIETYQAVKFYPKKLIATLKEMPIGKEHYYRIRKMSCNGKIERAAKFLYLNRLAFGGMYRVNKCGMFNVPFGGDRRVDILWTNNLVVNASKALKNAELFQSDFEDTIRLATKGDIVYCDPTYTVSHNDNSFQRYNEKIFSWKDQERLAKVCFDAARRGAYVIISNASHDSIKALYSPIKPLVVERYTGISRELKGRKHTKEFLFICDKVRSHI